MKLMGYTIIPTNHLTCTYRSEKRTWMDRIFSLTPWKSQKLVKEPSIYFIDNANMVFVSEETYERLKLTIENSNEEIKED